jgi:uncharacterized protein (TIGR02246 family)
MRNSSVLIRGVFLASLLILSGQAVLGTRSGRSGQADVLSDLEAIRGVTSGIIAADNTGDAIAVVRFYASDAVLLPPNDVPVVGKDAIQSRYEEGFRRFRFAISSSSDETHVFGDWAFDRGTTEGKTIPNTDEPSRQIHDKYVMILHREPGSAWKIARLIWNAAEPATRPKG